MGRHVWFRTPTKKDRVDIFDLYLAKVAHDAELDQPRRRDELARITSGYSPAMIEQVCSMALTYAHHSGRERFSWEDIFEAMATVESGTAINIEYVPEETRAVAIHEAGHAAAAHVYMKGLESTRVSIRRRGDSLGHHQALEKEERFSRFRSEQVAALIWTLGAMAAERVFYGENSDGVGGDVQSATARAAYMVGASAMGPIPLDDETPDEARERIMKRFEEIGSQIMGRTGGGQIFTVDPISSVLNDRDKRSTAARILGQAYMSAHHLMAHNKDKIEKIADELDGPPRDLRRRARRPPRARAVRAPGRRLHGRRRGRGSERRAPGRGGTRDEHRRVYLTKFAFAYAVLGLVALAAIGALVWAVGLEREETRPWSAWQPAAEGEARLWEIADHVGAGYADAQGRPIVQLLAAPPYVQIPTDQGLQRIQVDGVIVKGRASDRSDARAGVFRDGAAFMYVLCSTGGNCDLTTEQNQDPNLGLVLQREILELALYTFKYDPRVEQLLFFLPPFRTRNEKNEVQRIETVVYLERDDVAAALARPIDDTLSGSPGQTVSESELDTIVSTVRTRLFTFDVEQAPQGLTILTLERYTGE